MPDVWTNHGLVFRAGQTLGASSTHAQVPTPILATNSVRVFFSYRPEQSLSLTAATRFFLETMTASSTTEKPLLELGREGAFDCHGIMPSCAVKVPNSDEVRLYFSGWRRLGGKIPYSNLSGVAISNDGGMTFVKKSHEPILSLNATEPYSATSPWVIFSGSLWHMFYCSGVAWVKVDEKYEHTYDIKYAYSDDGLTWCQTGAVAIAQQHEWEAITRPSVVQLDGIYLMWYSFRGSRDFRDGKDAYRIGLATSTDLVNWTRRDDDVPIPRSNTGCDATMAAYPAAFVRDETVYLLFNGNAFGRDGFCLATADANALRNALGA